jgi:hypothetical protein
MLDPRTAHANWEYGVIGDPEGDYCIGRVTYWFDPNGDGPVVYGDDMWAAWPTLHDQWQELKTAAYARCQAAGQARGDPPFVLPYGPSFGGLFGPP